MRMFYPIYTEQICSVNVRATSSRVRAPPAGPQLAVFAPCTRTATFAYTSALPAGVVSSCMRPHARIHGGLNEATQDPVVLCGRRELVEPSCSCDLPPRRGTPLRIAKLAGAFKESRACATFAHTTISFAHTIRAFACTAGNIRIHDGHTRIHD